MHKRICILLIREVDGMLYCACAGDNSIWSFDIFERKNIGIKKLHCSGLRRLACYKDDLLAVCTYPSLLLRISDEKSIPVGTYPTGIYVIDDKAFISCGEANSIWVIDLKCFKPHELIACGGFPMGLSGTNGVFAFVSMNLCEAHLYSTNGNVLIRIKLPGFPYCAAPAGLDRLLCVYTGEKDSKAALIDKNGIIWSIGLKGCMPVEVRVYENNAKAVITDCESGLVHFLDLQNGKVTKSLKCGAMPDDICIIEHAGVIAVSSMADDFIMLTDLDGNKIGVLGCGPEPRGLAYSSSDEISSS